MKDKSWTKIYGRKEQLTRVFDDQERCSLGSTELLGILPMTCCLFQNKFQKNWLIWTKFITPKGTGKKKKNKTLKCDLRVNQSSWKETVSQTSQVSLSSNELALTSSPTGWSSGWQNQWFRSRVLLLITFAVYLGEIKSSVSISGISAWYYVILC